jgi:hypothetical protein
VKKLHIDRVIKVRLPITIVIVIFTITATFFATKAERDGIGYQPDQPINYSHALHAGHMEIDCQYCHTGVEKTRHASIPSASICMNCHQVARRESPEIQKLVEYYTEGKPIPWKRIHKVPDYAFFNHSVHVNRDINCVHCHGDIASMTKVSQKESFKMSACLSCHRHPEERMPELKGKINIGPETCATCHR